MFVDINRFEWIDFMSIEFWDIIGIGELLKDLGYYFDEELHLRRLSSDKLATTANIPVDPFATVSAVNDFVYNPLIFDSRSMIY